MSTDTTNGTPLRNLTPAELKAVELRARGATDAAIPEDDKTFGDRRPPSLRTDRNWLDTVPPMPAREAA